MASAVKKAVEPVYEVILTLSEKEAQTLKSFLGRQTGDSYNKSGEDYLDGDNIYYALDRIKYVK